MSNNNVTRDQVLAVAALMEKGMPYDQAHKQVTAAPAKVKELDIMSLAAHAFVPLNPEGGDFQSEIVKIPNTTQAVEVTRSKNGGWFRLELLKTKSKIQGSPYELRAMLKLLGFDVVPTTTTQQETPVKPEAKPAGMTVKKKTTDQAPLV